MQGGKQRSRVLAITGIAVLGIAVVAAWLQLNLGGERATLYVDDLATAGAALTATLLCIRAGAGEAGRQRRFWWLLAAAAGAWTIAEVTWAVYELPLARDVPAVSWADFGYLVAIPLTIAALISHPALQLRGGAARQARSVLDGLTVATALLFLTWTFVLGPLWRSSDVTTLSGLVTLAYPFGDVVIIFFIVLTVRQMTDGADRLALWFLLGGLFAMSLSDSTYAYLTGVKDFESGGMLDAGWVAAYLGIALSALFAASEADVARATETPSERELRLAPLVAPFLPLLLALGVLGVKVQLGHKPDHVGLVMAFGLVALVLIRQALLLLELTRRSAESGISVTELMRDAIAGPEEPETPPALQGTAP